MQKNRGFGFLGSLIVVALFTLTSVASAAEDFKGEPTGSEVDVGGLAGLGLIHNTGGFAVIGTVAKKIAHQGFVPDINNQVFIEAQLGPMFHNSVVSWLFSGHLRWDFVKDETWTFYALGGLGGDVLNLEPENLVTVKPRFGVGAFYSLTEMLRIRGELSHNLIAAGVSFSL